jgi:1,5-anhydro-D-fructose reductase (1,5-anhydro-D-mannitol-forming)
MIRIGIVGCGRILPAHLRGYKRLRDAGYDNFRITGLTARQRSDAEMFRRRGEGPPPRPTVSVNPGDPLAAPHMYVSDVHPDTIPTVYDSLEAMLESGEVDAIDTPSSVFAHHTVALAALRAGKHVLVQKPLAVSVRAGRQMVEAAHRAGCVLGVMENVRYAAGTRQAGWAIGQGAIGDVQMAASVSISTQDWSPDRVVADTPWRHIAAQAGGGATLDIGVHMFHGLRYLCGEVATVSALVRTFEPQRFLRAEGRETQTVAADADDAYMALLEFAGGGIGMASFTWAGHGEPTGLPDGRVIYGSKGVIKGSRLLADGRAPVPLADLFQQGAPASLKERYFPYGLTDTFALAAYDFCRAIEAGTSMEMSGDEGLRDLAAAFAMIEASHARQVVNVADVLSGTVAAAQQPVDAHYELLNAE